MKKAIERACISEQRIAIFRLVVRAVWLKFDRKIGGDENSRETEGDQ